MDFELKDNQKKNRFEVKIDSSIAFVEYIKNDGITSLVHTEVPEELAGQGIGSKMLGKVLSKLRDDGGKVKIQCPFIKNYVEKHPEYKEIVVN